MGAAKGDRILSRLVRELIDEALDGEHVVVRADTAPEPGDDPRWLFLIELDAKIGNVVGDVLGRIDAIGINALLEEGGQKARHHGRPRHPVLPASDSIALETSPEKIVIGGPVDVVADILLASPHDLYRPVDVLGDPRGGVSHVRLQPPAEAPADQMVVHGHLTLGQTGGLRHRRMYPLHHLGPDPRLGGAWRYVHRAVHGLHAGVRKQGHFIGCAHYAARGSLLGPSAFGTSPTSFATAPSRRLASRSRDQISSDDTSAFGPSSQVISSASSPLLAAHM